MLRKDFFVFFFFFVCLFVVVVLWGGGGGGTRVASRHGAKYFEKYLGTL